MKQLNQSQLNLSSIKLIEQCLKGNRKAQLELYKMYCHAMFSIALRYVRDKDLAQDITQEAFIKAFTNLKYFDFNSTFGAWLKQIVINQSIDMLRQRKFDLNIDEVQILKVDDEENWDVDDAIDVNEIKDALEKLPIKYRLVLKLFLMEGYDHEEISEILKISVNASRTQLYRGKKMLIEQLNKRGFEMRYNT